MTEKNKKTTDLNVDHYVDSTETQEIEDKNEGEESSTPCSAGDNESVDNKKGMLDLDRLRLSQDFSTQVGLKKILTTVPCRKPNRHEFVRVHPDEKNRFETVMFQDKITGEEYLVDLDLHEELSEEVYPVCLFTAITRQGDIFLWSVKLTKEDGNSNPWNESSLKAAILAQSQWVRVASNRNAGYYDTHKASGAISEPEWPDLSMTELINLCFKDRFISETDHPILRALRGEV